MPSTAVFTIVSKNYWHFARTLMDSVRVNQPGWQQFVLLVDELDPSIDPAAEPFTTILAKALPLPDPQRLFFRYTILELNTAVKPWMFEWLFQQGFDRVVFFDPDIYVYNPLTALEACLQEAFIVLTPHLTGSLDESGLPNERTILLAGTYNLGFIAINRHTALPEFLAWWQHKLERDCVSDLERGLFVDQKWLDLAPGLFPSVKILRDPGYNVAYWNLPHRKVLKAQSGYTVDAQPLVFFHFSGLNITNPEEFSKHQNRFHLSNFGVERDLVAHYCTTVLANGYSHYAPLPYAYGVFANGTLIPDLVRFAYRESPGLEVACGSDPFLAFAPFNQSYLLDDPVTPLLSHLMVALWERRPDLRAAFPDPYGRDRVSYAYWFADNAASYAHLSLPFIEPVRQSLRGHEQAVLLPAVPATPPVFHVRLARALYRLGLRAKSLIPFALLDERKAIKEYLLHKMSGQPSAVPVASLRSTAKWERPPGINIVGYLRSVTGVGESARASVRASQITQLPTALVDFSLGSVARQDDQTLGSEPDGQNPYAVNLFHINADQMPLARQHFGSGFFERHYNIGYWAWELADFPDEWIDAATLLQEIWVPSAFVQDAVSRKVSIPVLRMPHAIHLVTVPQITRLQFQLPIDRLVFLAMFDVLSFTERKNPLGVMEAFSRAFPDPKTAALVIKVSHANQCPVEVAQLRQQAAVHPNISILDQPMTRAEVTGLLSLSDVFVSLHRAEGFGLALAEAMWLGKPVIATNWSGNVDFMNAHNSALVDYRLVAIPQDIGPYKAGQLWAEPDLDQAAGWMQKLASDESFRMSLGAAARQYILDNLSPAAIGSLYRARLQRLGLI